MPSCHHVPRMRRALTLLIFLVAAAPAQAQSQRPQRPRRRPRTPSSMSQQLADGRGVRTGRELTPALSSSRSGGRPRRARPRAGRRAARAPDRPERHGQPGGPYAVRDRRRATAPRTSACTGSTSHRRTPRPRGRRRRRPRRPDYIDDMDATLRAVVSSVENRQLGWRLARVRRRAAAADAKTDVYIKDIGDDGHLRLREPDPGQRPQPVRVPRDGQRLHAVEFPSTRTIRRARCR